MPPTSSKPRLEFLEREIARLEAKFRESTDELKSLRERFRLFSVAEREIKAEIAEIREEWVDLDHKWFKLVLAALLTFLLFSYFFYANLGWYADQRALPLSSDWLLDRLPTINLLPLLSWGWLGLHLYAATAAILYYPRRMPFLLFLFGIYLFIRTVYVFLSPIGAPQRMLDMGKLDYLFSQIMGTYTFTNEFVFSGHTGIPFLFYLFFETKGLKTVFLSGSVAMGAGVLLTHNHYTIDVISAYFMCYAIFVLSRKLFYQYVLPLYRKTVEILPEP